MNGGLVCLDGRRSEPRVQVREQKTNNIRAEWGGAHRAFKVKSLDFYSLYNKPALRRSGVENNAV